MRLPVVPQISTKDGVSAKNARLTNCLKETTKRGDKAVIRPGLVTQAEATGVGGGLVAFNNELVSVYGATLGIGAGTDPSYMMFAEAGASSVFLSTDANTWTEYSIGSAYLGVRGMAANGNTICAEIGGSDKVLRSIDGGGTWTLGTLPATANYTGIAYGAGLFVIIKTTPATSYLTSPDGITWTTRNSIPSIGLDGWFTLKYIGGNFVAIAPAHSGVSVDGINWTVSSMPSGYWLDIAWNGSVYVAVSISTNSFASSPDGITWTVRTGTGKYYSVTTNNSGLFVAVWNQNPTCVSTSTDGINWSRQSDISSMIVSWGSVKFDGSQFIMFGTDNSNTYKATSSNGVTWAVSLSTLSYEFFSLGVIPGGPIESLASIPTGIYDFAQSPL